MALDERIPLLSEKAVGSVKKSPELEQQKEQQKQERWRPSRLFWICVLAIYSFKAGLFLSKNAQSSPNYDHNGAQLVSNYTCIPGQACWPSSGVWSHFNES